MSWLFESTLDCRLGLLIWTLDLALDLDSWLGLWNWTLELDFGFGLWNWTWTWIVTILTNFQGINAGFCTIVIFTKYLSVLVHHYHTTISWQYSQCSVLISSDHCSHTRAGLGQQHRSQQIFYNFSTCHWHPTLALCCTWNNNIVPYSTLCSYLLTLPEVSLQIMNVM